MENVLIISDSYINALYMKLKLASHDYQINTYPSVDSVLDECNISMAGMLLYDLSVSELAGLERIEALKEFYIRPIAVVSNDVSLESKLTYFDMSVDAVLDIFEKDEVFCARVKALLRRSSYYHQVKVNFNKLE